jgi:hypothetical protein
MRISLRSACLTTFCHLGTHDCPREQNCEIVYILTNVWIAVECSLGVGYSLVTTLKKPRASKTCTFKGGINLNLSEASDIGFSPCDDATPDSDRLLPHLRWELEQVMSRVRPVDLSGTEIVALLAVLTAAHCRVIGGPADRPRPLLGCRGQHPAPDLV